MPLQCYSSQCYSNYFHIFNNNNNKVVTINSNLRMTSLINGNVDCQPVSTLKADILNITYAYKLHSWSLELCGNNAHYVTYGEHQHAHSLKVKGQHILLLLFLHNFVHGLCILCVFNRCFGSITLYKMHSYPSVYAVFVQLCYFGCLLCLFLSFTLRFYNTTWIFVSENS